MIVVACLAFSLTVLVKPSFLAASFVCSITLVALGAAFIGALTCQGECRAFCIGFAVLGAGHLVLALGPWSADHIGYLLLSQVLLDYFWRGLGHDFIRMSSIWTDPFYSFKDQISGYAYFSYLFTGQSLFSLLVGYCGGLTGQYCHQRRTRTS